MEEIVKANVTRPIYLERTRVHAECGRSFTRRAFDQFTFTLWKQKRALRVLFTAQIFCSAHCENRDWRVVGWAGAHRTRASPGASSATARSSVHAKMESLYVCVCVPQPTIWNVIFSTQFSLKLKAFDVKYNTLSVSAQRGFLYPHKYLAWHYLHLMKFFLN